MRYTEVIAVLFDKGAEVDARAGRGDSLPMPRMLARTYNLASVAELIRKHEERR